MVTILCPSQCINIALVVWLPATPKQNIYEQGTLQATLHWRHNVTATLHWRHNVTSYLIGWAHIQSNPWK